MRAAGRREERAFLHLRAAAWLTANWGRAKTLPAFKTAVLQKGGTHEVKGEELTEAMREHQRIELEMRRGR